MSSESFDTKLSRVVRVFFKSRQQCDFTSPKYFKSPPGKKNSLFFKKFFAMGLCVDLYSANRIK